LEEDMKTEEYKRRLLAKEQELLTQLQRAGISAREPGDEPARDIGDESVYGERKEEQFREANVEWETLNQVRDALRRIESGQFGKCIVDGGPIEEKRLEAIPWTPYCINHGRQREAPRRTATL
jgi:DnaK suppressor protein